MFLVLEVDDPPIIYSIQNYANATSMTLPRCTPLKDRKSVSEISLSGVSMYRLVASWALTGCRKHQCP